MTSPVVERWTVPFITMESDIANWHRAAQTPEWAKHAINTGEVKPHCGDTLALHQDGTVTVERATIGKKEAE